MGGARTILRHPSKGLLLILLLLLLLILFLFLLLLLSILLLLLLFLLLLLLPLVLLLLILLLLSPAPENLRPQALDDIFSTQPSGFSTVSTTPRAPAETWPPD